MRVILLTLLRQKIFKIFLILAILLFNSISLVLAVENLEDLSTELSNYLSEAENVEYIINFTTASTQDLKQISFQFSTTSSGSTKPPNLDLSASTLSSTVNLSSDWTLNKDSASNGKIFLTRSQAVNIAASTQASVTLNGIDNPKIRDCDSTEKSLADICYIQITTYSDAGVTQVDTGGTSFTIHEDPFLSFEIEGIDKDQAHNGITTSIATTATGIDFSNIKSNTPVYAAQKISIRTNAPNGYKIYAKLRDRIYGKYKNGDIDPFSAVDVTWETPQTWSPPNGNSTNINTGWIGAGTSDTRVEGWELGSAKFGPFSQVAHIVAQSDQEERTEATIYITYAIEVNSLQEPDIYESSFVYDIQPQY